MPTFGRRPSSPDSLNSGELAEILDAVEQNQLALPHSGVEVAGNPFRSNDDPAYDDPNLLVAGFVGRITHTPPPQDDPEAPPRPDYTDARYWVEQCADYSLNNSGPEVLEFNLATALYADIKAVLDGQPVEGVETPRQTVRKGAMVTALNLAEAGPGGQTHNVPEGTLVEVTRLINHRRELKYFFSEGVGGTKFVVVRDVFADRQVDLHVVMVRAVRETAVPGVYDWHGDDVLVSTWPHTPASYYAGFEFKGATLIPDVPVLRAMVVDGNWHVEQSIRWQTRQVPPDMQVTDCSTFNLRGVGGQ